MLVHNILQINVCHASYQYFLYQEHCKNTRNSKCSGCLPRIRTEYAKERLLLNGANILNELPVAARTSENILAIREVLNIIFLQDFDMLIL